MMIEFYWWNGSDSYRALLPYDHKMVLMFPRTRAEKVSIMGNVIRQSIGKDPSSGTARYSRLVPTAQAEILRKLDSATTWCYMTWKDHLYKVDIDANIDDRVTAGKQQVNIDIKIISQEI